MLRDTKNILKHLFLLNHKMELHYFLPKNTESNWYMIQVTPFKRSVHYFISDEADRQNYSFQYAIWSPPEDWSTTMECVWIWWHIIDWEFDFLETEPTWLYIEIFDDHDTIEIKWDLQIWLNDITQIIEWCKWHRNTLLDKLNQSWKLSQSNESETVENQQSLTDQKTDQ